MPGMMLTNLFAIISRDKNSRRPSGEDNTEDIFDSLRDSDLEIVAELGRTTLQLQDIYHLNEGDVIDLNQSKDGLIQLIIGGQRWFEGRMGVYNKNKAIKIMETYHNVERRSN